MANQKLQEESVAALAEFFMGTTHAAQPRDTFSLQMWQHLRGNKHDSKGVTFIAYRHR